jgi:hypothetical protein
LEADGEDEEHQSQLARELEHGRIHLEAEVRGEQAGEQHAGDAEAHAEDADMAERQSGRDHRAERRDRMGDRILVQQFNEPVQGERA